MSRALLPIELGPPAKTKIKGVTMYLLFVYSGVGGYWSMKGDFTTAEAANTRGAEIIKQGRGHWTVYRVGIVTIPESEI